MDWLRLPPPLPPFSQYYSTMSPQLIDPPSSFSSLKTDTKSSSSLTYPTFDSRPAGYAAFVERAREVSTLLGLDVAERDAKHEVPYKQVCDYTRSFSAAS